MKRYFAVIVLALALARGAPADAAPLWSFDTIPASGDLTGFVGDTVGWGYEITNHDAVLWLQLDAMSSPSFSLINPLGTVDLFDFPILAPGTTLTVPYDGVAGLLEVLLMTPGSEASLFTATASWWTNDPLDPQDPGQFSEDGGSIDAGASLTVLARPDAQVPEPSDYVLLALGLGLLAVMPRLIPQIARGGRK